MKMKFYDALQLDPAILKRHIAACDTKQEKLYYWTAMAVRSVLIVAFAIVFISLLSAVFGADNTPLAVALFCIMLGIRFVNFEYCIRDSLLTLAVALAILVLGPSAAAVLPPIFLIPLHFVCFFSLLYITTQRPEMGNGGLYSFAYVYLTGNPVIGEALVRRGLLAMTGYLLCGAILFAKHRHQHKTIRFRHVVRQFDLSAPVCLWQLRMALGVSLVLTAGQLFGVERFMWMGFACASLLSEYPYSSNALPPLSAADHRCHCRFLRVFCSVFDYSGIHALPAGPSGRVMPGLLHRLPLQDCYELLWRTDAGRRHLRNPGRCGPANCRYNSGGNFWFDFCDALSPAGGHPLFA